MSNIGSMLARVAALAGGAIIGAFLANLLDKFIDAQMEERPDHEKSRYAQGLTPVTPQQPAEEQQ